MFCFTCCKDPLENAPTGIMITSDCSLKIYFTLSSIEYFISAENMIAFQAFLRIADDPPVPSPPLLEKASERNLHISWKDLPFVVGLTDIIEVQYQTIRGTIAEEEEEQDVNNSPSKSSKWNSLVTKHYYRNKFSEYIYENISPGRSYRFRIRYHCIKAWSDYSDPSPVYSTLAACPPAPDPPVCITITTSAAELKWQLPLKDNGSKITEFVLVGKSVGDEFTELYRGLNTSYLALGLYPEFGYSFKIAVVNTVGQSEFSSSVSLQTPKKIQPRVRRKLNQPSKSTSGEENLLDKPELFGYSEAQIALAINCHQAWHVFWDPKTEKQFYFNTILGFRQLQQPAVLVQTSDDAQETKESSTSINASEKPSKNVESSNNSTFKQESTVDLELLETDTGFRKKRYHFLRALHKKKKSVIDSYVKSMVPQAPAIRRTSVNNGNANEGNNDDNVSLLTGSERSSTSSSAGSRNDITKLELARETILLSFAQSTSSLTNIPLLKRFKVTFIGEEGIDSGGLGKEAFLLVAKDIVKYVKNEKRSWMTYTRGYKPQSLLKKKMFYDEEEEKLQEQANKKEKQEASTFIDGLFFSFAHQSSLPSAVSADAAGKLSHLTVVDTYLENDFLSPASYGQLLGNLIGKAVLDGHLIDFPLSTVLSNYILGKTIDHFIDPTFVMSSSSSSSTSTMKVSVTRLASCVTYLLSELSHLDLELYNSLNWMLTNDITNTIDETFTISVSATLSMPLCPNGENIEVKEENKLQYVYLILLYKFKYSIQEFIEPLLKSFHSLVPWEVIKEYNLSSNELFLMLNGKKTINIEELRAYCIYESVTNKAIEEGNDEGLKDEDLFIWNETNDIIVWLWRILRETSLENKKLFIQFFTGTTCIPLDGFNPPITIVFGVDMITNSLPKAHTCFFQLVLPKYDSYETMKDKLIFAIRNTNSFGFS
jgi:hypothetical protein